MSRVMKKFVVESSVKITPVKKSRRGRVPKYPFSEMKIGQSFFMQMSNRKRAAKLLSVASYHHGLRHGGTFSVRALRENGLSGARCWRVDGRSA